ncbi:Fdxacb1 [Symbiodinium sp. CCMP2592]|nr:Fdxacb1 [Symbiodinium sp. CCMP2592]
MAEWSVQDVVQDMKDNAKLLANRKGKATGGLQQGVLKSILFRLESLHHLDAAGALELHKAVQESSFPEDMQEAIAGKVDQLMGEACEEQEPATLQSLKPQHLKCLYNYFTQSEWDVLTSLEASWYSKEQVTIARLKSLGFRSLAESTVKHSIATMACFMDSIPSSDKMHDLACQLKTAFANSEEQQVDHSIYLVKFPDSPAKLPRALFEAAYPDEKPVARRPENYPHILKLCPVRTSHRNVAQSKKRKMMELQQPAATSSELKGCSHSEPTGFHSFPQSQAGFGMQEFMGMMKAVAQVANVFQQNQPGGQQFKPKPKAKALKMLPPAPKEPPAEEEPPAEDEESEEEEQAEKTTDEKKTGRAGIDEQLFLALKDKKANAGNGQKTSKASKAQGKPKSKSKAKGQAEGGKKPTAASLPRYIAEKPTAAQRKARRDSYVDKHYHKGRDIARRSGCDDEACKEYARSARAAAAKLWDK